MHSTVKYFKNFLENVWETTEMRNSPKRGRGGGETFFPQEN